MPTRIQHWHNQFKRNAATIGASLVIAAVIGVLYVKYIMAAVAVVAPAYGHGALPLVF